jgi:hypothetical protein
VSDSTSPAHQEVVKRRWVSERELRRERWRSWEVRMAKATATGMAIVMKVQRIQTVL